MEVLVFVLAYLLGSIPFALIIGKIFYGVDVREHGSRNLGATNTARVLGVKAGLVTAVGDVTKGCLAASLPFLFQLNVDPLLVGALAIVGHCFPVFAGFRGGKAAATTAGVLLIANPLLFLTGFLIFTSTIAIFKYVALGTMLGGLSLFIHSLIIRDTTAIIITGILFALLIFLHRSNIKNLLSGTELKVNDKRLKSDRIHVHQNKPPTV